MENEIEQNTQGSSEDFGVVDEPLAKPRFDKDGNLLEKGGKDQLKIKKHASSLVKFIKRSHTPITIGIQGEWGSGKTSLLNTIYAELELANQYRDSKDFKMIWVNTWENALMSTPEEALIKIINEIINELLESDEKISNVENVKKAATTALKGMLRVGASVVGGVGGAEVMGEVLESKNSVRDLRDTLTKLVQEIRQSKNQRYDKVVIFVDDLDRIDPPEAVKILELLKNIFSITGCVFILAIDYQVVIKGLREKFGERTPENEWEFRAFFDKIIQLPFLMPMGQYNIGNYVNDLLYQIGFQQDNHIDDEFIETIVNNTIGGNPRSIKRLVNSLALIQIFNQETDEGRDEDGDEDGDEDNIDEEVVGSVEVQKQLLFALVCLQIASWDVYALLTRKSNFLEWDEDLAFEFTQKKEEQVEKFQENFDAAKSQDGFDEAWEQALYRICFANPRERSKATDLSHYFNYLRESFPEEKCNLPNAISYALGQTAVTSIVTQAENIARPEKGSYKKHFVSGIDGWIARIQEDGENPSEKTVLLIQQIVALWKSTEFGAVDHLDDSSAETFIKYAGGITLYAHRRKVAGMWVQFKKKAPKQLIHFQILKSPKRKSAPVILNNMSFDHRQKFFIVDLEKRTTKGNYGHIEWQETILDPSKSFDMEDIGFLMEESIDVIENQKTKILTYKKFHAHVEIFRKKRKNAKAWKDAVDFIGGHFDEKNRVVIER